MIEEATDAFLTQTAQRNEQLAGMLTKILVAAQPGAVYSEPVTKGAYTVIMASEVSAGGGFGSGFGSARTPPRPGERSQVSQAAQASDHTAEQAANSGSGMGGGGGSSGRPVAIIIIGADGVRVRPVVDVTKVALAGVTVLGTVAATLWRMRAMRARAAK